jgi:hypothetical protein
MGDPLGIGQMPVWPDRLWNYDWKKEQLLTVLASIHAIDNPRVNPLIFRTRLEERNLTNCDEWVFMMTVPFWPWNISMHSYMKIMLFRCDNVVHLTLHFVQVWIMEKLCFACKSCLVKYVSLIGVHSLFSQDGTSRVVFFNINCIQF